MKRTLNAFIFLFAAVLLTACGNKSQNNQTAPEKVTDVVTEDKNTEDNSLNGPRIVTDVTGEVEIPSDPKRIADLTGASDILSILGYQVVATANSDAYDYTKIPSYLEETLKDAAIVGYSMQDTMDIEAIIAANPDLIILSTVQQKMYDTLKEVAPTVMVEMAQVNWKDDIRTFAKLFDREKEAEEWLAEYEKQAVAAGAKIMEKHGKDKTYLSFLASGGQFYIFSKAGLGDVLTTDMGLASPEKLPEQSDISLPVVTYEGLAEIDADYIIVAATKEDMAELSKNSIWNNLRAVKENRVVVLPTSPYFNQGYSSIGRQLLLEELKSYLTNLE